MIKANELRIGNYLNGYKYIGGWKHFVVNGSDIAQFEREIAGDFKLNCPKGIDHVAPIPLTPEILEMCGFVWDSEDNGDSLAEMYVLDKFVWSVGLKEMYYNNEPLPHIEYLHQLQNLVFALTGKELKVNFHVKYAG